MKLRTPLAAIITLAFYGAAAQAQTATDQNEGLRISPGTSAGTYALSWWGRLGRTYFIQHNEDLANPNGWVYVPIVESGANQIIQWGGASNGSKSFFRLIYSDTPTSGNASTADFDGDGVSNIDELNQGTDPLSSSLDTNGLPLDWEKFYGVPVGSDPYANPDSDGLTTMQAYLQKIEPPSSFQAKPPKLLAISGTPQTGPPGGFAPVPLTVQLANSYGAPLANTTVTFSTGSGQLQASSSATPANTLVLQTDAKGQARAFFLLPNAQNTTSTASALVSGQSVPAVFTITSDDGTGTYASPFNPVLQTVLNEDESGMLSWTHYLDGVTGFRISRSDNDGQSWMLLTTLDATSTDYTVPVAQMGIIGRSTFRVEPVLSTGGTSGMTNNAGQPSSGVGVGPDGTLMVMDFIPNPRYAVIDLGLTQTVGFPQQINNNGTVLIIKTGDGVARWRQGNIENLGTGFYNDNPPYPYTITDLENPYNGILDESDNVIINQKHPVGSFYNFDAQVYPASGASFNLAANQFGDAPQTGLAAVHGGDGGRFYGTDYYSSTDPYYVPPAGGAANIVVYPDGAWWTPPGPNSAANGGSVQWTPDPGGGPSSYAITERLVYSCRSGIQVCNHIDPDGDEIDYYLGNVKMNVDGDAYYPLFQNSKGAVLVTDDENVSYANNVNGVFSLLADIPFKYDDVWGFNAAQVTLTDAQGNQQKVDAPQLVGTDSDYNGVPFLYEENPTTATYTEKSISALLYPKSGWQVTSATGINDNGVIIGVAQNSTDGMSHAVLLLPANITMRKKGDPTPAPGVGVIVKKGDTVEIALDPIWFGKTNQFQNSIAWQSQQLQMDGTYTNGASLGTTAQGTTFDYTATTSGVFRVNALITTNGVQTKYSYLRKKDELKTSNGYMGPGRLAQPDAFGVCDTQNQIDIQKEAKRYLGSTAYAANTPVPSEFGFPAYPASATAIRCNIFVAHRASAVGAFVPGINGLTDAYPPLANQWAGIQNCRYFNPLDPSGPTYDIEHWSSAAALYPQPGFIIAHPDASDAGHCAITDYDGVGVGAGVSGTVNKNFDFYDGTSRWRQYQP